MRNNVKLVSCAITVASLGTRSRIAPPQLANPVDEPAILQAFVISLRDAPRAARWATRRPSVFGACSALHVVVLAIWQIVVSPPTPASFVEVDTALKSATRTTSALFVAKRATWRLDATTHNLVESPDREQAGVLR